MEDPVGMDILRTYCPDLVTGKLELDKSKFILQLVNLLLFIVIVVKKLLKPSSFYHVHRFMFSLHLQ